MEGPQLPRPDRLRALNARSAYTTGFSPARRVKTLLAPAGPIRRWNHIVAVTEENAEIQIDFEARDHVHHVVEASGTSFMSGMKVLPEDRREAMYAIYAFCREIDDIADEPAPMREKVTRLKNWRGEIDRLYEGRAQFLTARALWPYVQMYDLQKQDFLDLIDGMEMDAVEDIVAPPFEKLERYCDRVACAVGRLSVRAFGASGDRADTVAHHLGLALQLTNILRDVKEDADRGRLYLPAELLDAHGIETRDPEKILGHAKFPKVCADLADIAKEEFRQARAAIRRCPRRAMRPAILMMQVYRAILSKLEKRGWGHPEEPVSLSKAQKIWIAVRYGLI